MRSSIKLIFIYSIFSCRNICGLSCFQRVSSYMLKLSLYIIYRPSETAGIGNVILRKAAIVKCVTWLHRLLLAYIIWMQCHRYNNFSSINYLQISAVEPCIYFFLFIKKQDAFLQTNAENISKIFSGLSLFTYFHQTASYLSINISLEIDFEDTVLRKKICFICAISRFITVCLQFLCFVRFEVLPHHLFQYLIFSQLAVQKKNKNLQICFFS